MGKLLKRMSPLLFHGRGAGQPPATKPDAAEISPATARISGFVALGAAFVVAVAAGRGGIRLGRRRLERAFGAA